MSIVVWSLAPLSASSVSDSAGFDAGWSADVHVSTHNGHRPAWMNAPVSLVRFCETGSLHGGILRAISRSGNAGRPAAFRVRWDPFDHEVKSIGAAKDASYTVRPQRAGRGKLSRGGSEPMGDVPIGKGEPPPRLSLSAGGTVSKQQVLTIHDLPSGHLPLTIRVVDPPSTTVHHQPQMDFNYDLSVECR
jgi:hypothetical protein